MKLFSWLRVVPNQTRPDYDVIADIEHQFRMDEDGFNERYDEAIIAAFRIREANSDWDDETQYDEYVKICSEMTSAKYQRHMDYELNEVEREHFESTRNRRHEEAMYKALRKRMMYNSPD